MRPRVTGPVDKVLTRLLEALGGRGGRSARPETATGGVPRAGSEMTAPPGGLRTPRSVAPWEPIHASMRRQLEVEAAEAGREGLPSPLSHHHRHRRPR